MHIRIRLIPLCTEFLFYGWRNINCCASFMYFELLVNFAYTRNKIKSEKKDIEKGVKLVQQRHKFPPF